MLSTELTKRLRSISLLSLPRNYSLLLHAYYILGDYLCQVLFWKYFLFFYYSSIAKFFFALTKAVFEQEIYFFKQNYNKNQEKSLTYNLIYGIIISCNLTDIKQKINIFSNFRNIFVSISLSKLQKWTQIFIAPKATTVFHQVQ